MNPEITIRGARLHNLKNITLSIPKNQLVVLTGLSGSGKSTLGFDILFKEGQRQYLESLGLVELGLARPPVDAISGLSPTISVDQHLTNHSPRSTVGTATEVYYLSAPVVRAPGPPPLPDLRERYPALARPGRRRLGGGSQRGRRSRSRGDISLPTLRRAGPRAGNGPFFLQQARRGLPDLYRAGDRPPGRTFTAWWMSRRASSKARSLAGI